MSKNKKRSAVDTALERRMIKFRSNPFFTTAPIQKYCEIIKEKAYGDCDDCSYINFNDGEQYVPSGVHQLTGEAVVMVNRVSADPFWMQSRMGDLPDAEAFIGGIEDPVTGIPKTRAFWRCKLEETGEDHFGELESLYTVAIANYSFDSHNDEVDNTTVTYAVITGFINDSMFEMDFYEPPSIKIIKEFITDISTALKANPEKRSIDMPKKEVFVELIAKLTMMEKSDSPPSASEKNGVCENSKSDRSHYKKFDKQFKIAIVKRIKENRLPVAQVAEEEGIHSSAIHHWISEYEKRGENAFRGRGRVSPNKGKVIDRLFQDVADDKEKMLESRAYRQRSFDKNFKISTVKRIKENQLPVMQVAEKLGIDVTTINRWIRTYEEHGEGGFPGRNTPNRKKYDRQLKMVAVKLVKENNQPISKVEKNLGIGSGNLQQWLLQYEKYGESAFQGSGSISPHPDKRELIKELFKNEIAAAAVSDTTPSIDADKYGALNLTPEKEKELTACSYKLKRYDKDFKISTVKRIKENQLPLPQVSEILGIDDSLLSEWVREYDEKGENNAFPGGGYKSHNFQKIDAPAQSKSAEEVVLDTNSDTNSVKNTAANKKKAAVSSNRKNVKPVYDKQFKMDAVKYVTDKKLSPYQAAEELNVPYVSLGKWIREYEKHGENAFPGSGVYHDPNS